MKVFIRFSLLLVSVLKLVSAQAQAQALPRVLPPLPSGNSSGFYQPVQQLQPSFASSPFPNLQRPPLLAARYSLPPGQSSGFQQIPNYSMVYNQAQGFGPSASIFGGGGPPIFGGGPAQFGGQFQLQMGIGPNGPIMVGPNGQMSPNFMGGNNFTQRPPFMGDPRMGGNFTGGGPGFGDNLGFGGGGFGLSNRYSDGFSDRFADGGYSDRISGGFSSGGLSARFSSNLSSDEPRCEACSARDHGLSHISTEHVKYATERSDHATEASPGWTETPTENISASGQASVGRQDRIASVDNSAPAPAPAPAPPAPAPAKRAPTPAPVAHVTPPKKPKVAKKPQSVPAKKVATNLSHPGDEPPRHVKLTRYQESLKWNKVGSLKGVDKNFWNSFMTNFRACAPGCSLYYYDPYGQRDSYSCHQQGKAVDVSAIICGGNTYWAMEDDPRFKKFVNCMHDERGMKKIYQQHHGRGPVQDHWNHAHFSNGCILPNGKPYT